MRGFTVIHLLAKVALAKVILLVHDFPWFFQQYSIENRAKGAEVAEEYNKSTREGVEERLAR